VLRQRLENEDTMTKIPIDIDMLGRVNNALGRAVGLASAYEPSLLHEIAIEDALDET
jgi:hypothetical protein